MPAQNGASLQMELHIALEVDGAALVDARFQHDSSAAGGKRHVNQILDSRFVLWFQNIVGHGSNSPARVFMAFTMFVYEVSIFSKSSLQ